jgi:O-methyltransferase
MGHKLFKGLRLLVLSFLGRSEQVRYESAHELLSAVAIRCQMRMYAGNLSWSTDADFLKHWADYPERKSDIIHERKFNLFNIARGLRHIPGDIVECGVFHAASSFLMLSASEGTGKHLHGFDSFEGLSKPEETDIVKRERTFKWKENDLSVPENVAAENLKKFAGHFSLYKGWIPERFHEIGEKTFSLVHIDVDLFAPTTDSLEFFWPRLSPGGMIVCDDYGFETCPGARKAMDDFFQKHNQPVIHLTTGQGIVIRPLP